MDSIQRIRETNQRAADTARADQQMQSNAVTQQVLFEAFQAMVDALRGDTTKAEALSRMHRILDIDHQAIEDNREKLELLQMGLGALEQQLAALPEDGIKSIPKFLAQKETVAVNNFGELEEAFAAVAEAIQNQAPPVVNVPEPVVNVPAPIVNVPEAIVNVQAPEVNVPEPKVTTQVIVKDWKRDYAYTDCEKDEKKSYYGYVRPDGQWYIMCLKHYEADEDSMENSTGNARFVFGKKDYPANWKKHESLKFKYLHEAYLE